MFADFYFFYFVILLPKGTLMYVVFR